MPQEDSNPIYKYFFGESMPEKTVKETKSSDWLFWKDFDLISIKSEGIIAVIGRAFGKIIFGRYLKGRGGRKCGTTTTFNYMSDLFVGYFSFH